MRQGFRVIDSDTHVNPSLDVLLRYADQPLRDRLDELAPYMRKVKVQPGRGDAEDQAESTILSIRQLRYQRVAGEKPKASADTGGDRGSSQDARRWSRANRSPRASPRTTRAAVSP